MGRKGYVVVETFRPLLNVIVHPNSVPDHHRSRLVLQHARRRFPFIEIIFADAGYQGSKATRAVTATGSSHLTIVERTNAHKPVVLRKHWIVERTHAWISRRVMRDFEHHARTVATFVRPRYDPHRAPMADAAKALLISMIFPDRL